MDSKTKLARMLARAPAVGTPFSAPLTPMFTRGQVCGYNADGTLSITVGGSPSAINADALNGMAPAIGAVVELHTFGTRLVVDGVINGAAMMALKVAQVAGLSGTSGFHVMTFDTVIQDDSLGWTPYQFNVQSPGRYAFDARLSATAPGRFYVSVVKNGSELLRGVDQVTSGLAGCDIHGFADCVAEDVLTLWYYMLTGTSFETGADLAYFRIRKVS